MTEKSTIDQKLTNQFITQLNEVEFNVPKMLITNEDRVKSCLESYFTSVEKRRDWLAFFGIFLTILATLGTASFNDFLGIIDSKYTILAMFIIVMALSLIWSLKLLIQRPKLKTTEEIIAEMKGNKNP